MTENYEDIINLPHHVSKSRPKMARHNRAAQFAPFAALTGYDAVVREKARVTDVRFELDEYKKTDVNQRIKLMSEHLDTEAVFSITYFLPDRRKNGGMYVTVTGGIKKIDGYDRLVIMNDGTRIPMEEILDIEGDLFKYMK